MARICRDCWHWQERQPKDGKRIGWCDFNYPAEQRGIKTARQTCVEWTPHGSKTNDKP